MKGGCVVASMPLSECTAGGFSVTYRLQLPWEAFQADIRDLFHDKLSQYPAQSFWRTNSPTHFGGATGTFTAIEEVMLSAHELYTICPYLL